jgi:arginine:pyruvate transaminase
MGQLSAFPGEAVPVPLRAENSFRWNCREPKGAVSDRTRCTLICSPQNPTGTVHAQSNLGLVTDVAREHNFWLISDGIYECLT